MLEIYIFFLEIVDTVHMMINLLGYGILSYGKANEVHHSNL